MRRSAAPSQQQAAKRPRFTVPYKTGPSQGVGNPSGADIGFPVTGETTVRHLPSNVQNTKICVDRTLNQMNKSSPPGTVPFQDSYSSPLKTKHHLSHCTGQNQTNTPGAVKEPCPEMSKLHQIQGCGDADSSLSTAESLHEVSGINYGPAQIEDCQQNIQRSPLKAVNVCKKFQSPAVMRPQMVGANGHKMNTLNLNSKIGTKDSTLEIPDQDTSGTHSYFSVVWCKLSKKKHKKWEGDAILVVQGRSVTLYDTDGKEIGKGSGYKSSELASLKEDETLVIGGKEIQVMSEISEGQFKSGKCFSGASLASGDHTRLHVPPAAPSKSFTNPVLVKLGAAGQTSRKSDLARSQTISPKFDPSAPDALVMPRPSHSHQLQHNKNGAQLVDVVVDPHLSVHMRPHQREGTTFLYECVMGMRSYGGTGAILADDMGLGKTLQCIALIWTLLKQGPYGGRPVVKRVLVITPGSLVKNWSQEFRKWLGSERLQVFVVSGDNRVEEFTKTAVYPVLIISYEMFVRGYDIIRQVPFDLVVCDEGHRLKNTAIKTTSLVMSLETRRRIVLSGTPIQNDLQEFFSVSEFCNPGLLGTSAAFRRVYEEPILVSRQPGASRAEAELGEERASELARLTRMFVLRRTQEINNKYLPPKAELVIFCRPSARQVRVYREILHSSVVRSCLMGRGSVMGTETGSPHLLAIAALKQVCNHPALLTQKVRAAASLAAGGDVGSGGDPLFSGLIGLYPTEETTTAVTVDDAGKLSALAGILGSLFPSCPSEKVVLVSNHTKTLDLLQLFCKQSGYSWVRLDGQTPTSQRHEIVTRFNSPYGKERIFLLSSKAGGVGLNLVGASRLFLFDIDWNPANDLQAMARVWRDGQKKKVYIYRLLITGSIEEKVYQRQISKQGLSGAVMDFKASDVQFSQEDLKDLFSFNEDTDCETHSLLGCNCSCGKTNESGSVIPPAPARSCQLEASPAPKSSQTRNLSMAELLDWHHLQGTSSHRKQEWHIGDTQNTVSFLFWQETPAALTPDK